MINTVSANEFYNRVIDTRNDSPAAEELAILVRDLIDDVQNSDELLGKVDSYKDDLSVEAQAHYKACISI
jgi:uncharacterized membrane-anchored protein YjiN (DUF445 family)